jgi:uroporphyrinogen-III synthase
MPKHKRATLEGWSLISIRMAGDHADLRASALERGARAVLVSPMRYQPIINRAELKSALSADGYVFTSPAAVRFALQSQSWTEAKHKPCFVIGDGSAQGLIDARFSTVCVAKKPNIKSLLQHPALKTLTGGHVAVITAPDGREEWQKVLAKSAKPLQVVYVYARKPIALSSNANKHLQQASLKSARLISSQRLLQALWDQATERARRAMRKSLWVCSSSVLENKLHEMGVERVVNAQSPKPTQMVDALATAVNAKRLP